MQGVTKQCTVKTLFCSKLVDILTYINFLAVAATVCPVVALFFGLQMMFEPVHETVLQDSHREGKRTSLHRHTGLALPFESRSSQTPPSGPLHTTRLPCTNKWAGGDEHASFRSKRPWRGAKSAGRKFASCRFSSPPQGHTATNTTISDVPLWRLCQGRFTTPCIIMSLQGKMAKYYGSKRPR